ncbi:IS30 family transposase [Kribbella sp. CA-247076]|uniref:IS30 family transposase n=1 Tax=Kribbella sp. CA-247076 TaxID=3239941 RepID=UPI003D8EE844
MPGRRLDERERQVIERSLAAGLSVEQIGAVLGRHRTTIAREIERNGVGRFGSLPPRRAAGGGMWGRPRVYRAVRAQRHAVRRARRPKPFKLTGPLALAVGELLLQDWSPQQIAASLPGLFPGDDGMRVSHETIYQSLFVQTRGELRRELTEHLRTKRMSRKPRSGVVRRGLIGIVPISQRPAEVCDRAVPGHWEGDLLLGGVGKGAVITLVERKSRFVLLAPLPDRHTGLDLKAALTPLIGSLPQALRGSLTWDRGSEMSEHAAIAVDAGIDIYFADPHSPWQRGSNENTNGLLRQYWPKGADLRTLTQARTDEVAHLLNTRPRQTLGWKTPAQALNEALSATTS